LILNVQDVNPRLKTFFAVWFVVQIVLPFTAPLHTCDLRDIFGTQRQDAASHSGKSSMPTTAAESESEADAFVSPLAASALRVSASELVRSDSSARAFVFAFDLTSSPHVQQTVLRL